MRELHNRKIFKKILYSKLFIVIFFAISIFLFLEGINFYEKKENLAKSIAESERKLDATNALLQRKKMENEFIQSDRGKEEYLRELMPVAKEDEKVIIIYDSSSSPVVIIPKSNSPWYEFKKKVRYIIENYTNL
jgi:cell division protein FtsB